MPIVRSVPVVELGLDLNNFRTVPQPDEVHATRAMIAISPDYFWALTDSLASDGYLPIENIIVLTRPDGSLVVKEGNRRVASLKLLLGILNAHDVIVTPGFAELQRGLPEAWRKSNATVPCNIYDSADADVVDRIVTLTHGKNTKAGRDIWKSVARARHNRSVGGREPGLDLLEKYLKVGKNITQDQRDRWAGTFPITVLDEVLKKIAGRCGYSSTIALVTAYPEGNFRTAIEELLLSIGMEMLDFPTVRSETGDFALRYGIPPFTPTAPAAEPPPDDRVPDKADTGDTPAPPRGGPPRPSPPPDDAPSPPPAEPAKPPAKPPAQPTVDSPLEEPETPEVKDAVDDKAPAAPATKAKGKTLAVPMDDERSVRRKLKALKIHGPNREKLLLVRKEITSLKLNTHSIAFCFLLRSMFELSAKAYCHDHAASGLSSYDKSKNRDKVLVDLLRELIRHMTQDGKDKEQDRNLTGAMAELGKPEGVLSTKSMNQLVHNLDYVILPSEIPLIFGRIFPLLVELNK